MVPSWIHICPLLSLDVNFKGVILTYRLVYQIYRMCRRRDFMGHRKCYMNTKAKPWEAQNSAVVYTIPQHLSMHDMVITLWRVIKIKCCSKCLHNYVHLRAVFITWAKRNIDQFSLCSNWLYLNTDIAETGFSLLLQVKWVWYQPLREDVTIHVRYQIAYIISNTSKMKFEMTDYGFCSES